MEFIIITGMSGAGKSQAKKCLEDMNFYCIDNLPPRLIHNFIELSDPAVSEVKKAAFVIDIRGGQFFNDLKDSIETLKREGRNFKVLFMEASDGVLIRRYKETRRDHPMSPGGSILSGIREERAKLSEIRDISDYIIDTSTLKISQLKQTIADLLQEEEENERVNLTINVISFGYKNGIPLEADNVYDVRFLPNPFYLKSLKRLTGNNHKVREYVMRWEEAKEFVRMHHKEIQYLIPYYIKQGKSNLVLAFGCTGGQHRSVVMANVFYELLSGDGYRVTLHHRDL